MSGDSPLLLDNSAWMRIAAEGLSGANAELVAAWIRDRRLVVTAPFLLEAGYSARTAKDHQAMIEDLLALPFAALDADAERRAFDAQSQLARVGRHRLPPVDLLLAALADRDGFGILHCDRHYDLIAEQTTLDFESVWLPGHRPGE